MSAGIDARIPQEGCESGWIRQRMPSRLRCHGTGQVAVEMGENRAGDPGGGKFQGSPVRTRQIVPAVDDGHRMRSPERGGCSAERLGQFRRFDQVQREILD